MPEYKYELGLKTRRAYESGIILRTETCRKRILDYVSGKIPAIYEYEEKLLELPESANIHSGYFFYSTPNVVSRSY